jgi:hypothetical protein
VGCHKLGPGISPAGEVRWYDKHPQLPRFAALRCRRRVVRVRRGWCEGRRADLLGAALSLAVGQTETRRRPGCLPRQQRGQAGGRLLGACPPHAFKNCYFVCSVNNAVATQTLPSYLIAPSGDTLLKSEPRVEQARSPARSTCPGGSRPGRSDKRGDAGIMAARSPRSPHARSSTIARSASASGQTGEAASRG